MSGTEKKISPRALAHLAVARVEGDNAYLDIVLSHILESQPLDERDRAFISELVRGTIRWKKRFDWIIDQLFRGENDQLPAPVRWLLWQALYQLEFMNVPAFAAVNECVKLARAQKQHRWTGVLNAILRTFTRHSEAIRFPDAKQQPVQFLATTESHPEWLVERWINQFGFETTRSLCKANNETPNLSVRVNQLKLSTEAMADLLTKHGIDYQLSSVPGFFRLGSIRYDLRSTFLKNGWLTIQDESAGLPGILAQPQPGQIVADLCAAPGGKSTHLAELMKNLGLVISGDVNDGRARLVQQAAQRLDLGSLFPVVADAEHFPILRADVVLLDAPCSGFGIIRKKPDLRWKKRPEDLMDLQRIQRRLIQKAAALVSVNGILVYSTCTFDPDENECVVEEFLGNNPNFEIVKTHAQNIPQEYITAKGFVQTWPQKHHMDGSFAAKLIKRNELCREQKK